ncbi:MAG: DUF1569 domain-containing protein [Saprospiraceae bacterium]
MTSVFVENDVREVIKRINLLTPDTKGLWGKMSVAQMLAHCNVTYEMIFTDKHPKPNFFKRWLLKSFVKDQVVGPKPYPKNGKTAPAFIINHEPDFNTEKQRLIDYIDRVLKDGEKVFNGRESLSFGKLNIVEWNTLMYKHLDYHLSQFGV